MGKIKQIYSKDSDLWLNDNHQLWRYIPYKTAFSYMEGKVFIPSLNRLNQNDPFEGNFPIPIAALNTGLRKRCQHRHESVIRWIHDNWCTDPEKQLIQINNTYPDYAAKIYQGHYLAFLRKTRYAWCWFLSGIESALMWESYGRNGVAVGTTVGKLKAALEKSDHDFVYGKMNYRGVGPQEFDSADRVNESLLTMPYFFKRQEYRHEQEVRFVTTGPGNDLMVDLPPDGWINEFRLHPKLQPSEAAAIQSVVKKVLPNVVCEKSDLLKQDGATLLEVIGLSGDLIRSDFKSWKDGSDQTPECLKNDERNDL